MRINRQIYFSIAFFCLLLLFTASALAQESTFLITYGTDADKGEGDSDYIQVVILKIPNTISDSLYVRIYDADCGGEIDGLYAGNWDTKTEFSLYGGANCFTTPGLNAPTPETETLQAGTLIKSEVYGEDPFIDNKWNNFAKISPNMGEKAGGFSYFKLVVKGRKGNDGNVFDLSVSVNAFRNIKPAGIELFGYGMTLRLPEYGFASEMRFKSPEENPLIAVHNFDLSAGSINLETKFRSDIFLQASGQNTWEATEIRLQNNETGKICAVKFSGGLESPNDASFWVSDSMGKALPILLPIYKRTKNNRPVISLKVEQLADCNTILFDASKTRDPDKDELSFFWDFGDNQAGQGSRLTHFFSSPGTYKCNLIVEDGSGHVGNSSIEFFDVTVNYPPVADAGADKVGAPGEKFSFDASGSNDPDGSIKAYFWDFGDSKRAQGVKVTHSYKKPDYYNVKLRVEDNSDSPCNTDEDQIGVWVNAPPVVEIGEDINVSIDQTITFDGSNNIDTDGKIVDFQWDMGDGNKKQGMIVDHAFSKAGTYRVTLTISDNAAVSNSSASDRKLIFVNDPPVADAGPDHRVAVNEKINFNGSGSYDNDGKLIDYEWNFGDGGRDDGIKTSHDYDSPGRYWVALTVQDNSATDTDTDTDSALVIINYPPVADAGLDQLVSVSEVHFDASGSYDEDGEIIKYDWDFGDGKAGAGEKTTHVYANPGVYTVTLNVTDDSKTSTKSTSDQTVIRVNYYPIADAGPDLIGAPGEELIFDGSNSYDLDGQVARFVWSFGDNSDDAGETVRHAYEKPGHYSAVLKIFDNTGHNNAVGFDSKNIWINRRPNADAGRDIITAPGVKVGLDGSNSIDYDGKIVQYIWEVSDDKNQIKSSKITKSFAEPGFYTAKLTVFDDSKAKNSTAQDRVNIYVNHRPISKAGSDIHTCERTIFFDGSASTDADGDKLKYIWDFGDGGKPEYGEKVSHTYKHGGRFPVLLTVDDGKDQNNSRATSSITVRINEAPTAIIGDDMTVCAGDVVIFDGGNSVDPEGGNIKYNWDFGDGTVSMGINPTKVYKKGGVYLVTLNITDDSGLEECNFSQDQIIVWVAESPVADAGPDQTVCANSQVEFDGSKSKDVDGLVNSFEWDFGDGTSGGGMNPTHVYKDPGKYRVILTITGDQIGNCDNTATDEMMVEVFESPVASFESVSREAKGKPVLFDASKSRGGSAEIIQWAWDFGDSAYAEGEKVEHTYNEWGKYIVTLKVTTDSETECAETSTQNLIYINEQPVAGAGEDKFSGVDQILIFNGSESSDIDGAIDTHYWDFGDGASGNGVMVRHKYDEPGVYTVTLTVKDDTDLSNNTDVDTLKATINNPPEPKIIARNLAGVNEEITFDGRQSKDRNSQIKAYFWSFGDDENATGEVVKHRYAWPGGYTAILKVDDGSNAPNSIAQIAHQIKINSQPVANAGNDKIVSPNQSVTFSGANSMDPDGSIAQYEWTFGDGSKKNGKIVEHSYVESGLYTVTLSVIDNTQASNNSDLDSLTVRVNSSPVANAGQDLEIYGGGVHDKVTLDGAESYDPDGDPLSYKWYLNGKIILEGSTGACQFPEPGEYTVKLEVDDGLGTNSSVDTDEINIKVMERR